MSGAYAGAASPVAAISYGHENLLPMVLSQLKRKQCTLGGLGVALTFVFLVLTSHAIDSLTRWITPFDGNFESVLLAATLAFGWCCFACCCYGLARLYVHRRNRNQVGRESNLDVVMPTDARAAKSADEYQALFPSSDGGGTVTL